MTWIFENFCCQQPRSDFLKSVKGIGTNGVISFRYKAEKCSIREEFLWLSAAILFPVWGSSSARLHANTQSF